MDKSIQLRANTLPGKIQELHDFVILNTERLKAYRARVDATDKLAVAKELRNKAVQEGQILAGEVFYAEAKLGKMIRDLCLPRGRKRNGSSEVTLRKIGITKKESHEYQRMAAHPKTIEEVLEESKKRGNVPYRKSILKRIDKFFSKRPKNHVKQIPATNNNHKRAWRKVIFYQQYYILNIKPGTWGIFSPHHTVKSEKEAKELIKSVVSCDPADVERSNEIEKINALITFCLRNKEAGEEIDIRNCNHRGCPYADNKPAPLPK